jgi:hypothetical protein
MARRPKKMKSVGKLVFLLALVVMFGPAVRVEAADGAGDEVANVMAGWLEAVAYIGGIILFIAGLVFVLSVLRKYHDRLAALLPRIDVNPAVLAFGNSVPGKAINDALGRLLPQVDEPTDPFIQRTQTLPVLKQLYEWGWIDGKTFSELASRAVRDGVKLTNGVPDVEFSLLDFDSTLSGSARAHAEALRLGTEPSGVGQFPNG